MVERVLHRGGAGIIAIMATIAYIVIQLRRYATFQLGMDLGLFGQAVRGYAQGHAPLASIKTPDGFNLLGDHFTPIVALLAPFYRIWPDTRVLLIGQAILFGAGVWIIGQIAVRRLGVKLGLFIAVAVAFSWGFVHAILFDFHEIAFAVPVLALALLCVTKERWAGLIICTILLWLTKEDCTFITAGIGLTLIARKKYWQGLVMGAASVIAFFLLTKVIIPPLSYSGRYTYFKVVDSQPIWQTLGTNITSSAFVIFMLVLVGTLGLGLASPTALTLIPIVASRLVSSDPIYFRIQHHYNAPVMVICFMAIIEVWARLRDRQSAFSNDVSNELTLPKQGILARAGKLDFARILFGIQAFLLVAVIIFGIAIILKLGNLERTPETCVRCQELDIACSLIPPDARVAGDAYVVPHLVDTAIPSMAIPEWEDQVGEPLDPDWVILDTVSTADGNLTNHWEYNMTLTLPSMGYHEVWSGDIVSVWSR